MRGSDWWELKRKSKEEDDKEGARVMGIGDWMDIARKIKKR